MFIHDEDDGELTREQRLRMEALMAVPLNVVIATHDLIARILLGKLPDPWQGAEAERLTRYLEVLCWILGHRAPRGPGAEFARQMEMLCDLVCDEHDRALAKHRAN